MSKHLLARYKPKLQRLLGCQIGPDKRVLAFMLQQRDDEARAELALDDFRTRLGHLDGAAIVASLSRLKHRGIVSQNGLGLYTLTEKSQ